MPNTTIKINNAYLPHLFNNKNVQIYFGGSSSGKSYFIFSQRLILELINKHNVLIVRKTQNSIIDTVWAQTIEGINNFPIEVSSAFKIKKSERKICAPNKYMALFKGLDDIERLKGIKPDVGVFDTVIMEEATEATYDDYKKLRKRLRGLGEHPKRIILLFNPIDVEHWIYKEFFENKWDNDKSFYEDDNISILRTTYKDNIKNLGKEEIDDLENEVDQYYYQVYTLGNFGIIGDRVFTNYSSSDLSKLKNKLHPRMCGKDFGWESAGAFISCYYSEMEKTIYVLDEIYGKKIKLQDWAEKIKEINRYIVNCDHAEPRSVAMLHEYGVNVKECKKTPDHMKNAIHWINSQKMVIDTRCINLINELNLFAWRRQKTGEKRLERKNDHAIQALIYALEDKIYNKTGKFKRIGSNDRY